jgi:hypothetical protein
MLAIMRFVGRRQAGHFGPAGLLVIVMIADAAQNGLGKDYSSVTEGVILVLTIVGWEFSRLAVVQISVYTVHPEATGSEARSERSPRKTEPARRNVVGRRTKVAAARTGDRGIQRLCTLEGDGRLSVLK